MPTRHVTARALRGLLPVALATFAAAGVRAQAPPDSAKLELVIGTAVPVIDGDLSDWRPEAAVIRLDQAAQITEGKEVWSGASDSSGEFLLSCDTDHLYLAGLIRDDQIRSDQNLASHDPVDRIELRLFARPEADAAARPDEQLLQLMPLSTRRPWNWVGAASPGGSRQTGLQLTGVRVARKRLDDVSYQFEAAIPFHQWPSLRPGSMSIGFDLALVDVDERDGDRVARLQWAAPVAGEPGKGLLLLPAPGPLVSTAEHRPLFADELLDDAPFLLVPLATVLLLVVLLRGWKRLRVRAKWLRPTLVGVGLLLFLIGLLLPGRLAEWRAVDQRQRLDASLAVLRESILGTLEPGTLKSYRGASRDRALVDLLSGRPVARQRYTSYRSLAQLVPDQFGPPPRTFDDLPVRPYWLPLSADRPESFPFDPPLRGTLHLVVGRPFVPTFPFAARTQASQRLRLELDYGNGERKLREIDLDRPFADGASLGRDFWEVCVVPVPLDRDLRALSLVPERGSDLSLVGLSLENQSEGKVMPLLLGAPSLGGVLTDLRGPQPADAGVELAPGATTKVALPALDEPPQKLWLFYRAVYPGLPTANPGAKVAEVVLHFADPSLRRTVVLEHQISMFYELAVHNTRDEPPDGSPAAIALRWADEGQEKHVNLVYPMLDLPAGSALVAIEFRNLADYRMRFRSVVLGNERQAAPQDPVDAPIVRRGNEILLQQSVLDQLVGTSIAVYRNGRLSESTLPPEARADQSTLPRAVTGADIATAAAIRDGSRRLGVYMPLGGDGWDGAVLGVTSLDRDWASVVEFDNRLGFFLCLLGTPFVLVLLSELLSIVANLRFRLMAVMSIAALLPLAVLSLVLVRVLEDGHATNVRDSVFARVRGAMGQLEEQKDKVKSSARTWLHDLVGVAVDRLGRLQEGQPPPAPTAAIAELQKLLAGQLPPEWGGGFLRLEWQPTVGKGAAEPLVVVAGDERMANIETPARLEPGIYMQWGMLMIGVRAEESVPAGTLTLTAGRPLDGNLLGAMAPGQVVILTDVRGYPVAASSGHPEAEVLLREALDPQIMAQRERTLLAGVEQHKAVFERMASPSGRHVYGNEVLRDLQDTPRGLLVVAQPDQRAMLDLAIGRVPVRAFFLLVAGSLVVLAAFLSFVVSGRISRPIERLELGARALSRGAFETRVPAEESGQIGQLTRTFNRMAADLQARMQDLQALNRAMRELSAPNDEATTLDVLRRFCASHSAADAVRILLTDVETNALVLHAGGASDPATPPVSLPLARFAGAFSCVAVRGALVEPVAAVLPGCRCAIGMPIAFGGQTRGLVLLGFERTEPLPVDLELLSTVVAQAAVALERSQLHRLAVQDPITGLFTPEYFRRLVADAVSLAQQRGQPVSMVAMQLGDGDRRPRGLRRFASVLHDHKPEAAVLCHVGAGRFHVVLPGLGRPAAAAFVAAVGSSWAELAQQLPENEVEERPPVGVVVQFPDEAPSAEFLFEALRARLEALNTPGAAAMESDESLQRAGVTAISPAMREVYGTLRRVAPTDLPILLEGETGVGKEVLTNLVHRWSRRTAGPLIKVHCAALSETLLASELFGHERGAFTGAERRKIGRFEQADGGTLFLDEVGDIPLDVQVKLLRVLQEGEVDRVGGTEPVRVDVRVIAATNRDIAQQVAAGQFREDLYYRLQGVVVRVPPLRERRQELASLVEHFRREVLASGQGQARLLSTDAMDELYRQDWPGNVRELRNTVVRAMVLARSEVVQQRDILAALAGRSHVAAGWQPAPVGIERVAGERPAPTTRPVAEEPALVVPAGGPPVPPPGAEPTEPTVWLPRVDADPEATGFEPGPGAADLPPRLRDLLDRVLVRGAYTTQDHMEATGVSHRTGLRDLQLLLRAGLVERVGSRRGAFYRPTRAARILPPRG